MNPRPDPALSLSSLLLLALALRLAAHFALPQPLQSDGLAYFTLAQHLAAGDWPSDNLGQHAFYSIGYPLVLAPFFALLGASTGVAFAVNLALAMLAGWLVALVARACALPRPAQQLALLGYALWLPGIWNCTLIARENLSTPLLLLLVWLALRLSRQPSLASAALAGLAWAAALLAGSSALPLLAAPLLAIAIGARWRPRAMGAPLLALLAAAALMLAPWSWATRQMLGHPILSTNSGFNLYLGNNPSATGRFVSIAATPVGPQWQAMRARLGESGATSDLGQRALVWMRAHPAQVARLTAIKLALFWAPNLPDAQDFALSRAVACVRLFEVIQYLLFLALALLAIARQGIAPAPRAILLAAITGFWALHGLAYIIERYRDPVMPLLIILAAAALARLAPPHKARAHVA